MTAQNLHPTVPPHVRIAEGRLTCNSVLVSDSGSSDPAELYHALGCNYPKFFKMDSLCRWAWLGAEALLKKEGGWHYDGLDKREVAVVIATRDGCLEVDHRFAETTQTIPSPALFVYTLPNIMLGEICIRHGFTGEQLCEVMDDFDAEALLFWAKDLLANRGATHCLLGWANAIGNKHDVTMMWLDKAAAESFTVQQLQSLHISFL